MQIQDATISRLIERIGEHYRSNITNRFVRPALLQLSFDNQSWALMEDLTEKESSPTIHLEEVYRQITAAARFVAVVRRDLPDLRSRVSRADPSAPDKVLREMAVKNFGANLQVFADLVNELFIKLVEIDKSNSKGAATLYSRMPELSNVGRLLVG
ncbi:MAG: hypothetical protein LBB72_09125 [Spirochaetaceae bacterium]|jgi:hypothetical protein|nr:hypothetical protein [Spirochaetaceae bacterium]